MHCIGPINSIPRHTWKKNLYIRVHWKTGIGYAQRSKQFISFKRPRMGQMASLAMGTLYNSGQPRMNRAWALEFGFVSTAAELWKFRQCIPPRLLNHPPHLPYLNIGYHSTHQLRWSIDIIEYYVSHVSANETTSHFIVSAASIRLLKATKICVTGKSNMESYNCVRCNYTEPFQSQTRPSGGRVSTFRHKACLGSINNGPQKACWCRVRCLPGFEHHLPWGCQHLWDSVSNRVRGARL